jgi:hypothetical protein
MCTDSAAYPEYVGKADVPEDEIEVAHGLSEAARTILASDEAISLNDR